MKHSPEVLGRGHDPHHPVQWWMHDAGLETVEYALLAAILLGAVIALIPQFPNAFTQAYSAINDALAAALSN